MVENLFMASNLLSRADTRRFIGSAEPRGQIVRFTVIGLISASAYVAMFVLLEPLLGAQGANAASTVVTGLGNVAANRALTFDARGVGEGARHYLLGLVLIAFGLLITSDLLLIVHEFVLDGAHHVELFVLSVANLAVTLTRFGALRWIFTHGIRLGADAMPTAAPRRTTAW